MKWLIGLLLILGAGVAGVYVYQEYVQTGGGAGPAKEVPAKAVPAKSEAQEGPTRKKVVAPMEKSPPPRVGGGPLLSVISLPPVVANVRFGMSPETVVGLYNVVQRPTEDDTLVLVQYLRPDKMEESRFIFVQDRLKRIELVTTPRIGEDLDNLHRAIRDEYRKRYGKLPNSRINRWSDGVMEAGVNQSDGVVTLYFKSKR